MRRLLVAELRRAASRRLVIALAGIAVIGVLVGAAVVFARAERVTGFDELERRRMQFDQCMAAAGPADPASPADPSNSGSGPPGIPPVVPGEDRFQQCVERHGDPFVARDPNFRLRNLPGILLGMTAPLAILAWLIGASLIGAEWRAGTVTTTLTWEPDRLKLFAAKAAAAAITVAAFTLLVQALLALSLTPAALLRGSTEGFDLGRTAGVLARTAAFASLCGLIGFGIGSAGRNTAASLGVGFLYLAVLEGGLVGNIFAKLRPWLFVGNAITFVTGTEVPGDWERTAGEAALLLCLYTGAVVVAAGAIFRRRDVT